MIETWAEAHSSHQGISEDDADEIWDWMREQEPVPLTLAEAKNATRH